MAIPAPAAGSTSAPAAPPPACIRRGNQWLEPDDLRAHLAALSRLENVSVLLGAGASAGPLGGQTMAALWESFTRYYSESHTWLVDNGFLLTSGGPPPNLEELADTIEIARLEWERQNLSRVHRLKLAQADLRRAVVRASILQQDWWTDPELLNDFPKSLENHRQLLLKLTAARQPGQPSPWIFTTNYDLAIEWAAESVGLQVVNGFAGIHNRHFSAHNFDLAFRNASARGEARFGTYSIDLVKLHGSMTWVSSSHGVIELSASQAWPNLHGFIEGTKQDVPGYAILPSAAKYSQTVGFLLGELFRRLTDILSRPQTCLIVSGYSFNDEHINRALLSALQNPTLHIVAFLPEIGRGADDEPTVPPTTSRWIGRLISLSSPQVTIVGGGAEAYFAKLVAYLPDPAIYDEQAKHIRELMKSLHNHA